MRYALAIAAVLAVVLPAQADDPDEPTSQWQCGRDFIRLWNNGWSVGGFIYRNATFKNYTNKSGEDFIATSVVEPHYQRPERARFKTGKFYYHGKACAEVRP